MSKITEKDLAKINCPCKSCDIFAVGRGKNKKIYCDKTKAKLTCDWQLGWFPIPDCPLNVQQK